MSRVILKSIGKCVVFGLAWAAILFVVAIAISNSNGYDLKDVLFVEGIIFVFLGLMASIGGNPMGLSMQVIGQNNAQFLANVNLEVTKVEREKTHNNMKTTISIGLSTASLVIGGTLSIILNFLI